MKRKCRDCAFFVIAQQGASEGLGYCHRFPPRMVSVVGDDGTLDDAWAASDYPVVDAQTDWCGEFVSGESLAD